MLGGLLLATGPARADPPSRVAVQIEHCGDLNPAEVGRLLDIELATVTAEIRSGPPLTVQLGCQDDRLTITVLDPITRKRLARDIPAPRDEPGRERVVALAISQLFAASWLELLTATEPPPRVESDTDPPPDATAVEAARRVAEQRTGPHAEPDRSAPRRELELLVGTGIRGRALQGAGHLAAARTELRLRGWLSSRVGLLAVLGWDFGQSTRRLGRVRGHVVTAGGGLAWGVRPGRTGIGGHVSVAGGWARVRGVPREPSVPAGANAGFTGEVALGVGPRIRYGRLRLDLDAELGAMLPAPVGLVDQGPPMSMGGMWAGVLLRLGGALR